MSELISKLSSYNIFNYLFPWVVFLAIVKHFTDFSISNNDLFTMAFIAYFVWLVISRIGSVFIEPVFKKMGIIKFADYKDFIEASNNDQKIEIFSEQNNVFRTIISMLILALIVKLYSTISVYLNIEEAAAGFYILIVSLLIIFVLAYRKQTDYITKRVNKALGK